MRLNKRMRQKFIDAVMADVPKTDYREKIRELVTEEAAKQLPPKIKAIWDDKELRGFVHKSHMWARNTSIDFPGYDLKVSPTLERRIDHFADLHEEQVARRQALKQKLYGIANSCFTSAALIKALPEFAKYVPEDEPPIDRSVPAIANVVADFIKAGWPKGEGVHEAR